MTIVTERESVVGWETLPKPVSNELMLALRIWTRRDALLEQGYAEGQFNHEALANLASLANELNLVGSGLIASCCCVLPEHSCRACRAVAKAIYILQEETGVQCD